MANVWLSNYLISVHQNADGLTATGIETLCFSNNGQTHRLAHAVQKALISATKDRDRGVKIRKDLGILRKSKMPAILIESGFISNPETEKKLQTRQYQTAIARAICDGIADFAMLKK